MRKSKGKLDCKRQTKRRHIEDAPFYNFKYGHDELPLDPARSFLQDQIMKLKQTKPKEFEHDFDLYALPPATGTATEYFRLPTRMFVAHEQRKWTYAFETDVTKLKCPWLHGEKSTADGGECSEVAVRKVAAEIVSIYQNRRMKMFASHSRTKSSLYARTLDRAQGGPTDTIATYRSLRTLDYQYTAKRPSSKSLSKFKAGNERQLRTTTEIREELFRMKQIIGQLIAPDLKRYQERVAAEAPTTNNDHRPVRSLRHIDNNSKQINSAAPSGTMLTTSTTATTTTTTTPERKPIRDRHWKLIQHKINGAQKAKHKQPLCQDPDTQRKQFIDKYEKDFQESQQKFTEQMRRHTLNLMNSISVLDIEHYPSMLIIASLRQIDKTIGYLGRAYKFILDESEVWPHVKREVILMDFLFNSTNQIKREQSTLIMALLIDLQEDFRYHIKRTLLRYVLRSPLERIRLQLEPEPDDFPVVTIRAPVPWQCTQAKECLRQILMIDHPVLQGLNMLWHQLYHAIHIVDTSKFYNSRCTTPLDANAMTKLVHNCCMVARDILVNDWLPRAADLIEMMKPFWQSLVTQHTRTHENRAVLLFKCIHALMSHQVHGLIHRSVNHFYETILRYRHGNRMDEYNSDHIKLKMRPLMTLNVSVVGQFGDNTPTNTNDTQFECNDSRLYLVDNDDPQIAAMHSEFQPVSVSQDVDFILENSGKMFVEPYMEELPDLFVSYFVKILKVGARLPRMEYFMSGDEREHGYLHCIDEHHVDMVKLFDDVRRCVCANQPGPTIYLYPIYTYYFPILSSTMNNITRNMFAQQQIPDLVNVIQLMNKFKELLNNVHYLRDFIPLNLFMLDNRRVNHVLAQMLRDLMEIVAFFYKVQNQVENRRLCDEFEDISLHAGERPKETPEVVALQNYLNECRDERLFKLKDQIKIVAQRVVFLLTYANLTSDDIYLNSRTFLWPAELEQVLDLSAARLNVVRDNLEVALKERRINFEKYIRNEKIQMDLFRVKEIRDVLSLDDLHDKVVTVDNLMDTLERCSREAKAINDEEQLLQIDQTIFPILGELIEKMDPIEKLWHTAYHFEYCYDIWYNGPFVGLNADAIRNEVETMSKVIYKLVRSLATNSKAKRFCEQVRLKIDKFKIYMTILDGICREGMADRHWLLIGNELGQLCNPNLYPTLGTMVDIDIMRVAARLEEISNAAGREYELNSQLTNMQSEWSDATFDLSPYRDSDTCILAAVDDIQTLLDDHILKAQAMRSSPYIHAIGERATQWEDKLIAMQDILDVWLLVQATWMYLEPIFNSEDIMRQMPTEGRNFKAVDRQWRKIMGNTQRDSRVIQATDFPEMLTVLRKAFQNLEEIQKGLNMYLEKKRLFFARFFFLSNDELLEILSETKDPMRVQPHLRKCFEGIFALQFDSQMEIVSMISAEGEAVPFVRKINPAAANGLVEKWLKDVELLMLESMHEQTRAAFDAYTADDRKNWVLQWPGQVVQCISCMTWTYEVEEAIEQNKLGAYLEKSNSQIVDIVELVRGNLSPGTTITIEALIVLDVHARDCVKYLIEKQVASVGDFNWFAQLRYYWRTDEIEKNDYVCVSMVATDIRYGMEYLGNIPRLVVTPLTDRCYRTLLGALKLNLGGAPEGPAGTGKTETCKDLAKAVAKKCVVFNCSDGLDYQALGKFFKGLAQSGSWACFDEFNRIELEVLSVVAQQILTIQRAIARKVVKFFFEDTTLKLDPTCTIFITMNPGYAGRTELPDNLKVLFRTVAMMVPDYAMIGEITLYSNGFNEARPLAQKIVHTYKLCSEQLSSQHHYDYGMRAVKSVLLASGALRRMHPELSEQKIVLRAIIDVNLPKFLQQDVPLFEGIYADLFPGVDVPQPARDDVLRWLRARLETKKLQATDWFVEKVMQIYEMLLVRHGLMIVGGPMAGKTTAYQTLAEVLRDVQKDADAIAVEYSTNYRVINPKAISIGHLYGCFDAVSHEWSDGVLAKTFRDMAYVTASERNWIVFDGPVDAVWIENLNTVLDDNKKLCLMSGEIIQMSKFMNLIFEPADLEQASPATVSRCGMIYMEPSQLGWESLHKTYVLQLEERGVTEIYISLYEELVEWLIQTVINIVKQCKAVVDISPMHSYRMFTVFFSVFIARQTQFNQQWFQQTFLFCLVWSFGSTLTVEGRRNCDAQLRKILYGANEAHPKPKYFSLNRGQIFPEKMSVLDYRYDGQENWWSWLKSEEASLPADALVSDLMVTTKETGYILHWLDLCVAQSIPILLIGPTGTGKSAIINNFMAELPRDKYLLNVVNFSARTSALQVQELVMSKLDRRRKGVYGPPVGKKGLIFIDDIAMPAKDVYGSQPPLELLRQWLDHGHWSDLKDTSRIELIDLLFVGAMGLVGGSNYIFPRLYRHAFVVAVDAFEDTTLNRIFSVIAEWHFAKDYVEPVARLAKNISTAVIEVYRGAMRKFLPTPAKSHYTFSLRDVTRVFQGIVMVPPKRLGDAEKLARLWAHETYRVFYDRLVDDTDRTTLFEMVTAACSSHLRLGLDQACASLIQAGEKLSDAHMRDCMFGNYMEPDADPRIYDEVDSIKKLNKIMHFYLNEYNAFSQAPMDLVLFRFAVEHVSRVSRILEMPRGNVLLVGIGGSGRRSAVKLAVSIAGAHLMQVEVTRAYGPNEWREDIKRILLHAGLNGKPTVFLFCDSQAKDETFVEDINSILNAGDLSNLFQSDEKGVILERMQTEAKIAGKKIELTPLALYGYFIERVRESLHIALAFSPIGNAFKERLRIFPSLINCCTIDWFSAWPDDALLRVAENFIRSMEVITEIEPSTADLSNMSVTVKSGSATGADIDATQTDATAIERNLQPLERSLIAMVMHFNVTVVAASVRFHNELGRKNYVTPTSYLEMLRSFKLLYAKKFNEITVQRDRYTTGLEKLEFAAGQVAVMQANLFELQPQLKILSEQAEKIMVTIERETAEAEKKKEVVGADEAAANESAAAAQAIKDDCESDLAEAEPALDAANAALDTLKPADITVIKSMKNPPAAIKLVLESLCVLKGIKPERKPDATGKMIEEYWGPSVKMLADMRFLESLKTFDKNNIAPAVMKKIRDTYISDRDFIPEKIKSVSTACEGLCRWVRAMDVYDKVTKIVAPKKVALAAAESELTQQMEKLNAKRDELQEVLDKLQNLNDFFAEKSREKKKLEDEIENCEKKLARAERLLGGLGGEKSRWQENAHTLHKSLDNVVGDVLLAAGCVAYLGCFTTEFRLNIVANWEAQCNAQNIAITPNFSLIRTLGNPMKIRSWTLAGLPSDNFSTENGIIVSNSRRWPLMIDPQGQANKWVRGMEKENNLKVIKQTDTNYTRVVENAIQFGHPLLLENIGESVDTALFSVLERNVVKQKGGYFIRFGDSMLEYNQNFRFYLTTCLRNPHYLPETAVLVTLLNFMITEQGLREQLLATVVIQERPELQEKKELLIVESARNRDALYSIESQILQVLSSSEGNILEDENAINILSSSKILSEDIQSKQVVANATEQEIDSARQLYAPVAQHSAVLFFCVSELANIDPMYQYSLMWFLNLFVQTIIKAPAAEQLNERLINLNDFFTKSIYDNVCRSLFEKDKLIFSFVMCIGILRAKRQVNDTHFAFLLTGGLGLSSNLPPNPAVDWLADKSWTEIVRASELDGLQNLYADFMAEPDKWRDFYELANPQDAPLPVSPFTNVNRFLDIIILKCIRPDKLVPALRQFIVLHMNESFVTPPPFDLVASFADSSPTTPLIFLLSAGTDPMSNLLVFAKEREMYDKCVTISLGQGQGPRAAKMIADGMRHGHWVVLQNCHVAESWMDELERLCMETQESNSVHFDYRLWCTSYPSRLFPVSVLQNSVKMTNEPPRGLRANMLRSFTADPLANDKFYSNAFGGNVNIQWLRGVFSLVFFHAVLQERRDFGPLGWNIPYEFNESDLKISIMQLKMFLKQYNTIPFDGHKYLTGECNYGGRVTDDKDRRLLTSLLDRIYNETAIQQDNFSLSDSGDYRVPLMPTKQHSIDYIVMLPLNAHPEVYGLHENADINKNVDETNALLSGALLTQTASLASTRKHDDNLLKAPEDPVLHLCKDILERLPPLFDEIFVTEKYPVLYTNSMNTVLRQELIRFNRLVEFIKNSLVDVRRAVSGQIAMIPQLEQVHRAMSLGRLPDNWLAKSYPSLKPLASYVNDLLTRLTFFQRWIDHGEPDVYWLSGFYFTQSFITGVLQNYSRKNHLQIDMLTIKYQLTQFANEEAAHDADTTPEIGVYIKGLYLEGARWNRMEMHLDESLPKILFDPLPIAEMMPILKADKEQYDRAVYDCPIYKTTARRGILSTTGHSTNFVMYIELDTVRPAGHWVNRGTACLCQLDD